MRKEVENSYFMYFKFLLIITVYTYVCSLWMNISTLDQLSFDELHPIPNDEFLFNHQKRRMNTDTHLPGIFCELKW